MTEPNVVTREQWLAAHEQHLVKEKAHLRAGDALAAERRRLPMVEIAPGHVFEGPHGEVSLPELFEGRPQLALYSFMFPAGGTPCVGCSFFADQVGHLAHVNARGTTVAFMSRASMPEIEAYRQRMGWDVPWYSLAGAEAFYEEIGVGTGFALNVFLHRDGSVLHASATLNRGVEAVGTAWSFLDRTPMGRQETWEDAPDWVPQTSAYEWWRRHDEYPAASGGERGHRQLVEQ
jgi:predicted dithiol-disulfide oxidoreductase (DUF899 family)